MNERHKQEHLREERIMKKIDGIEKILNELKCACEGVNESIKGKK